MAKLQEVMNRRLVQGVFRLLGVREFPALRKDGFFGSNERDMKNPKNPSKHKVVWHFVSHKIRRGTNNIVIALFWVFLLSFHHLFLNIPEAGLLDDFKSVIQHFQLA